MARVSVLSTIVTIAALASPTSAAGGWYLMMPATVEEANADAPLQRWKTIASFDTAKDCEAGKTREIREAEKGYKEVSAWPGSSGFKDDALRSASAYIRLANEALCISTDDPRLTPKSRR